MRVHEALLVDEHEDRPEQHSQQDLGPAKFPKSRRPDVWKPIQLLNVHVVEVVGIEIFVLLNLGDWFAQLIAARVLRHFKIN